MDNKTIRLMAGIGLLTSICLAGTVYLMFSLIIPWLQSLPNPEIVGLFMALVIVFGTGTLWGCGIGWLMKADSRSAALTGGKNWLGSFMILAIILELIMVPLIRLSGNPSINLHHLFTLAFALSVGLAAFWISRKVTERIGLETMKTAVGRNSGLAAAPPPRLLPIGQKPVMVQVGPSHFSGYDETVDARFGRPIPSGGRTRQTVQRRYIWGVRRRSLHMLGSSGTKCVQFRRGSCMM